MRHAFTLMELLIVVAMILIVASMVVPNLRRSVQDNGIMSPTMTPPLHPVHDAGRVEVERR